MVTHCFYCKNEITFGDFTDHNYLMEHDLFLCDKCDEHK